MEKQVLLHNILELINFLNSLLYVLLVKEGVTARLMVYKKYIKRGNKLHGPYYYESYRDESGRIRKRYLGTSMPKAALYKYFSYFILGFFLLVFFVSSYFASFGSSDFLEAGGGSVLLDPTCGDDICDGSAGENFETCLVDCECFGKNCLAQNVTLKTAYAYEHSTTGVEMDELIGHGINAFIVKGGVDTDVIYLSDPERYPDGLPDSVRYLAGLAEQRGVMFFQGFNFVHHTPSPVTGNYVVFSDGTSSTHVTPFDEAYWDHLANITFALANLSVSYPGQYRVDGIFLDFELYGMNRHFDRNWGFEDTTFNWYLDDRGIDPVSAPNESYQRAERFQWLTDQLLIEDYYSFLESVIHSFAESLRDRVRDVNPDFIIAAYPSPSGGYGAYHPHIYDGWSSAVDPALIWATETFSSRGNESLPSDLRELRMNEGYFNYTGLYGGEIYGYYVGALSPHSYFSGDWTHHLFYVSEPTDGFWIWTTHMFTEPYEELIGLHEGYQVFCYNETENLMYYCHSAQEYEGAVQEFYDQMDSASYHLNQLLLDENYDPMIPLTDPPPQKFSRAEGVDVPEDDLEVLSEGLSDNFQYPSPLMRLRRQHNLVVKAGGGETVEIGFRHVPIFSKKYPEVYSYLVNSSQGVLDEGYYLIYTEGSIKFVAPYSGFYSVASNPGFGYFYVLNTSHPLMIYESDREIEVMYTPGNISFWVGDVDQFSLYLEGTTWEGFRGRIFKNTGQGYEIVEEGASSPGAPRVDFVIDVSADDRNEVWKVEVTQPDAPQVFEDVRVGFGYGIDPYFSLTDNPEIFMRVVEPECPSFKVSFTDGSDIEYSSPSYVEGGSCFYEDDGRLSAVVEVNEPFYNLELEAFDGVSAVWFPYDSSDVVVGSEHSDDILYYPYLMGVAYAVENLSEEVWEGYGEWYSATYSGLVFSPILVRADDSQARLVAAANWPPRSVSPVYSKFRDAIHYNVSLGAGEAEEFGALIKEIDSVENGVEPWQLAVDDYKVWLKENMYSEGLWPVQYPEWFDDVHGWNHFVAWNKIEPFDINAVYGNYSQWRHIFPWMQFWGQMSGMNGHCCALNRTVHETYLPELLDFIQDTKDDGGYVGFYQRPMRLEAPYSYHPYFLFDDNKTLLDYYDAEDETALEYFSEWIRRNRGDYGTNAFYLDVVGATYLGDPHFVAHLFYQGDYGVMPQTSVIEYPVDVYPTAFLAGSAIGGQGDLLGGPGMKPGDSEKVAFANFGRYILDDREFFVGESNYGKYLWGTIKPCAPLGAPNGCGINRAFTPAWDHLYDYCIADPDMCWYWMERQAFLTGSKFDAFNIWENATALDMLDVIINRSVEQWEGLDWWDRDPKYYDTKGIWEISDESLDVRRFVDKEEVHLFTIDNPHQLGQVSFKFYNEQMSIEIPDAPGTSEPYEVYVYEYLGSPEGCFPDWKVLPWGDCVGGQQLREIFDTNGCGDLLGKPAVSRSCGGSPSGPGGDGPGSPGGNGPAGDLDEDDPDEIDQLVGPDGCEELWDCGSWGECVDGLERRECFDLHECGTLEGKPAVERACEGQGMLDGYSYGAIFAGVVASVGLIGLVVLILRLFARKGRGVKK